MRVPLPPVLWERPAEAAAGAVDLLMLRLPFVITDEPVEEAVGALGDAFAAGTQDR
jgi:hypothetical protein